MERTNLGYPDVDAAFFDAVSAAIEDVAEHGDTDIFPSSDEAERLYKDRLALLGKVLELHADFSGRAAACPSDVIRCLVPSGYMGYRLGSQIPPVWNIYYLALVIACGSAIERIRAPTDRVFSYRFSLLDGRGRIFDPDTGWTGFQRAIREACGRFSHVLVTDISDFYHRVRVDAVVDALGRAGVGDALRHRLGVVLRMLEVDRFGLPVGGGASRLLAELSLAATDDRLQRAGSFSLRFVDDIRIFAHSEEEAHQQLLRLADLLWQDGFSLQKSKTRVLQTEDLLEEMDIAQASAFSPLFGSETPTVPVMLPGHDPYGEMRVQMDLHLSNFASRQGAVATIIREFSKNRLDLPVARNLLAAISRMSADDAATVLIWLLDRTDTLSFRPIVSRIMEAVESSLPLLDCSVLHKVMSQLEAIALGDGRVAIPDYHRALATRLIRRSSGSISDACLRRFETLQVDVLSPYLRREVLTLLASAGMRAYPQAADFGAELHDDL